MSFLYLLFSAYIRLYFLNTLHLQLSIDIYLRILFAVLVSLVTIHCLLNYYSHTISEVPWLLHQLFELDTENNLPTWFSSFLLFNNALITLFSAQMHGNALKLQWRLLSVGFLILAIDEVAGLHESFHTAIDFNWVLPASVLVGLIGVSFIPFLSRLDKRLAIGFIISGLIYIGGALGVEFLAKDMDEDEILYGFATAIEEGMEMLGALFFLAINLQELRSANAYIKFR